MGLRERLVRMCLLLIVLCSAIGKASKDNGFSKNMVITLIDTYAPTVHEAPQYPAHPSFINFFNDPTKCIVKQTHNFLPHYFRYRKESNEDISSSFLQSNFYQCLQPL